MPRLARSTAFHRAPSTAFREVCLPLYLPCPEERTGREALSAPAERDVLTLDECVLSIGAEEDEVEGEL